jgi:hypothetical protein
MTASNLPSAGYPGEKSLCRVMILHESDDALRRVTHLCDHLTRQHWLQVDLEFEYWPFSALHRAETEPRATRAAIEAEIVMISAMAEPEFPEPFVNWAERWVVRRAGHEGALVGALVAEAGRCATGCERDVWLHRLALRAGMDYLRHLPDVPKGSIPNTEDWCSSRAAAVTDTLSGILRSEPGMHPE